MDAESSPAETLQLLGNRVAIRRDTPKKRVGLIWVPPEGEKAQATGVVVHVGAGTFNRKGERVPITSVEVGDRVLFGRYAGYDLDVLGENLQVMAEHDLLAVVEGESDGLGISIGEYASE